MFGVLVFFVFPSFSSSLSCLYYRVRADEPLTPHNTMTRNCSSLVNQCVKIIHKTESEEYYHVDSYIEGRCAYSKEECDKPRTCFPEKPREQAGFTTKEYKCCSAEELSNTVHPILLWISILLHILQVQQFLLE